MKKILFIIALMVGFLGNAQLINPSTVNFIDNSVTIESCESSISTQADLVNSENANKVVCLVGDIVLSSDVTLPSGMVLVDNGGSLNFNGHTVTLPNFGLASPSQRTFISINGGAIHDSSTLTNSSINLAWFDLVGDGNKDLNTGTNNRNTFLELAEFISSKKGIRPYLDKEGAYLYLPVASAPNANTTPTNLFFSGEGIHLMLGKGVTIGHLSHNLSSAEIINFWNCVDCSINGGQFDGDLETHTFGGTDEGVHGVVVNGLSKNVVVRTISKNVSGDDFINKYSPDFAYLNSIVEASFTKNFTLSGVDGSTDADNRFSYSQRYSVSTSSFTKGHFVFGGGSFAGTAGLDVQNYWVAFYDNTSIDGNTTTGFIGKSEILETYQPVDIPENCTHIRLIIYSPLNWAGLQATLYSPTHVEGMVWDGIEASWGVRQGLSNSSPLSVVKNSLFEYNGRRYDGTTGSPGYGNDQEDGYQNLYGVSFFNNIWQNNKGGDFILKGPRDMIVAFNRHLYNTAPNWVNVNSISLANGERTMYMMNVAQDRTIDTGRNDHIALNNLQDVELVFTYENEVFANNHCYNCRFDEMIDAEDTGVAYVKDNFFFWNKPLDDSAWVGLDFDNLIFIDNIWDFGGYTAGGSFRLFNLSGPGSNLGYIDRLTIRNLKGTSLSSDGMQIYVYDVKDLTSSVSLDVRRGSTRDVKWEDIEVTGWVYLNLTDYPTTNGGNSSLYDTWTFEDMDITIDDSGLIGGSAYAFRTSADDLNVVWNGGEIDMQVSSNRFMDLNHYGTTTFNNVTFIAPSAQTINLTTLASGDDVIFNNCTFINVSVTLRVGDENNNPINP